MKKIINILILNCLLISILLFNYLLINNILNKFLIIIDFKILVFLVIILLFIYIIFLFFFLSIFKIQKDINFILQFNLILLIVLYFILFFFLFFIDNNLNLNIYQSNYFKLNIIKNFWTDYELYDICCNHLEINEIQINKKIILEYINVFKNPQELLLEIIKIKKNTYIEINNFFSIFIFPIILTCFLLTHICYLDINFFGEIFFQIPIDTKFVVPGWNVDIMRSSWFFAALSTRSFCVPDINLVYPALTEAYLELKHGIILNEEESIYYTTVFNNWKALEHELYLRMQQYNIILHYLYYFKIDGAFKVLDSYKIFSPGGFNIEPDFNKERWEFPLTIAGVFKKYSH